MENVKQNEVSTTEVEEMIEASLETAETEIGNVVESDVTEIIQDVECDNDCSGSDAYAYVTTDEEITEEELEDLGGSTATEPVVEMTEADPAEEFDIDDIIQKVISENGENFTVTHSVVDRVGNTYICGIDKNAGPIIMKKVKAGSDEQGFISTISGIVNIKTMMLDHSRIEGETVVVIVGITLENKVTFIVMSTSLDVISQKTTDDNFIVTAITKWKSQYIVGTAVRNELDEKACNHAIMILDSDFDNAQVMVFGPGDAAEVGNFGEVFSSNIVDLRIIDDKLYVGSVFFDENKMISNIAYVDDEMKVGASVVINIDGAKITRLGMIIPTNNGMTIIGSYSFDGEKGEKFSMNLNKDLTRYVNHEMVVGIDQSNSVN